VAFFASDLAFNIANLNYNLPFQDVFSLAISMRRMISWC